MAAEEVRPDGPERLSGNPLRHLRFSDARAIVQLATQATAAVSGIAEGVHQSVWNTIVPGGTARARTRGVAGLVYRSVSDGSMLVGKGMDTVLAWLEPWLISADGAKPETPQREALIAVLNGMMGDRLVAKNNPFAIPMTLRYRCEAMNWQAPPPMPDATAKVLVLIHGLCGNDLQRHAQYKDRGVDHGEALASALGYTPVYVRYNSGLHTSQNGRELSIQLEQLVAHWPKPIEELTVVGYSMGGLLARSAFHYGRQEALSWPDQLKNLVFLGTPHHGAPLERVGNWVDVILGSTPYTAPFAKLGQLRSVGITDLRHGHLLDEDWHGYDRFRRRPDDRRVVPLPEGVSCYTVAATKAAKRGALANRLTGDGLVPLYSALGRHDDSRRSLVFAEESQRIVYRTNHMGLLSSPDVTRQMVRWLRLEPKRGSRYQRPIRATSRT